MKIIVGSENKTKIRAVKRIFNKASIYGKAIDSNVSAQPIGDVETLTGAIERAKNLKKFYQDCLTIGLEGGVSIIEEKIYLCSWGAMIDAEGRMYTASGARIQLPQNFHKKISLGQELSEIMNEFTQKEDIRNHQGAIGVFTNNLVNRTQMFEHVVTLLKGQYLYEINN